jgi:hypothetical protein
VTRCCSREFDDVRFISGSNPLELSSAFQLQLAYGLYAISYMVYGSWSSGGFVAPVTHRICRFLLTHIRNHQSRSHLSPVLYSRSQKSKHNEGRPNLCASTCSAHSRAVLLSCDRKGLQNMLNPFERHYRRSGRHLSPSAGRMSIESITPGYRRCRTALA